MIRGDRVLVVAFAVIGAVILFAAMDNVAEVFFAQDTLDAGAWGYGVLASAWLVGMVGGRHADRPAARRRPAAVVDGRSRRS